MEEYKKQTMTTYSTNPKGYEQKTRENMENRIYPFLEKFSNMLGGKKVLDIGCGPGVHLEWFRENGLEAMGIDLSDSFIEICSSKGLNVRKMDMEQPLLYPQSFDGIWAVSSLLHVPKEKVPAVIKGWARLLKPNGILFLSVKEGSGEGYREDAVNGGKNKWTSFFTEEELKKLFSSSFDLIESNAAIYKDGFTHINIFFKVRSR